MLVLGLNKHNATHMHPVGVWGPGVSRSPRKGFAKYPNTQLATAADTVQKVQNTQTRLKF